MQSERYVAHRFEQCERDYVAAMNRIEDIRPPRAGPSGRAQHAMP